VPDDFEKKQMHKTMRIVALILHEAIPEEQNHEPDSNL
jgi:hypothetical protein